MLLLSLSTNSITATHDVIIKITMSWNCHFMGHSIITPTLGKKHSASRTILFVPSYLSFLYSKFFSMFFTSCYLIQAELYTAVMMIKKCKKSALTNFCCIIFPLVLLLICNIVAAFVSWINLRRKTERKQKNQKM